jgi:hypothetical protein
MTTTDPLSILPAAVEAAQRTASEIVAEAIRAAERAGYERALAEQRASAASVALALAVDHDSENLIALLKRAKSVVRDLDKSSRSIDGLCDEATVITRKNARRDTIEIPSDSDTLSEISKFIDDYGGHSFIDPEETDVDTDSVREAGTELVGLCSILADLVGEAFAQLGLDAGLDTTEED